MDYFFILKMIIVSFYALIGGIALMKIIQLQSNTVGEIDCRKGIITPELGAVVGATIAAGRALYKIEEHEFQQEEHYVNLILAYGDDLEQAPIEPLDDIMNELDEIHNEITSLSINHARKTRLLNALEPLINEIRNRQGVTLRPAPAEFSLLSFSLFSPRADNEMIDEEEQFNDENDQLSDEDSQPDDQRQHSPSFRGASSPR